MENENNVDVSIIIPIYNGEKWIDNCFQSIISQTAHEHKLKIELSIFDDSSSDNTEILLKKWKSTFIENQCIYKVTKNSNPFPQGAGFAKNAAIRESRGEFLCFQDIDDQMLPDRIWEQYNAAKSRPDTLIGCQFRREPPDSTTRYTNWANSLSQDKLDVQIYTSHGPTVIMPTWFFNRKVFERVGGFSEDGKGTPEDLIFFYKHINNGGKVYRVDKCLVIYTYHSEATTFTISSERIWKIRIEQLQKNFLDSCTDGFTVWNAGKQGRKFLKSLNSEQLAKVKALCDVDVKKIGKYYEMFCPVRRKVMCKISIRHFSDALSPFVICVKLDMTDGAFEDNLLSLKLKEGVDYVLFS